MPDDDELDDPGKTENRGWPAPGGPGAGKSTDEEAFRERLREAEEQARRERERRDRRD